MAKWSEKEQAIKALERNGRVDPAKLVAAARNPAHPCHKDFTWDDTKAAAAWRHAEACAIIRQCKFEVIVEDIGQRSATYYVPDAGPDGDDPSFLALPKIRNVTTTARIFEAEVRALHGLASRVLGIAEAKVGMIGIGRVVKLRGVCDTIKSLIETEDQ